VTDYLPNLIYEIGNFKGLGDVFPDNLDGRDGLGVREKELNNGIFLLGGPISVSIAIDGPQGPVLQIIKLRSSHCLVDLNRALFIL